MILHPAGLLLPIIIIVGSHLFWHRRPRKMSISLQHFSWSWHWILISLGINPTISHQSYQYSRYAPPRSCKQVEVAPLWWKVNLWMLSCLNFLPYLLDD